MTKKRKRKKEEKKLLEAQKEQAVNTDKRIEISADENVDEILQSLTSEIEKKHNKIITEKENAKQNVEKEEIEKLKKELAETKKTAEDFKEKWIRLMADFDNYKKRTQREKEQFTIMANARILKDFIDIKDDFDRAMASIEKGDDTESFVSGIKIIYKKINDWLKKEGVEKIDAVGKPFDPKLHEALMQMDSEEYDENIVSMEMTAGYIYKDKILRHSKVGVSKGKIKKNKQQTKTADNVEKENK